MKFSSVYVEDEVRETDRVRSILDRLKGIPIIEIERYGEVFNRGAQNFRLQKRNPALILAKKHGSLVLDAPDGYGFTKGASFYFSHMYNCIYDCRYCFLQGMYRSANYVLFTNYEDFANAIAEKIDLVDEAVFYSGYDCDSLALEPVSEFVPYFVPFFERHPNATLELRTKSTQVRTLLSLEPIANCVVALSFTPEEVHRRWESKVPSVEKRVEMLRKLQDAGWRVALRFEPLIFTEDFSNDYKMLFEFVFARIDAARLHSTSVGHFRVPAQYFSKMLKLYPDDDLLARDYVNEDDMVGETHEKQQQMQEIVESLLEEYLEPEQVYHCG